LPGRASGTGNAALAPSRSAPSCDRFAKLLAPAGSIPARSSVLHGGGSLAISFARAGCRRRRIDADHLAEHLRVNPAGNGRARQRFVRCGAPLPGMIAIRTTRSTLPDLHVGRIDARRVMSGFGSGADANALAGRLADTGDIGIYRRQRCRPART
jgi:hypothetical protein